MSSPEAAHKDPAPMLQGLWHEIGRLSALGFPIVISLAAATLIGVVDTIMIAPLGTVPLAAASITNSIIIVFYSGLYGFIAAIGVRMANAVGANDPDEISSTTRSGILVAVIVSVVGAAAMILFRPVLELIGQPPEVLELLGGYWTAMSLLLIPFTIFYALKSLFDAMNAAWIGVGIAFAAVFVNIPANWILIHGFGDWAGLGLVGAGLASLLSQSVALIIALIIWRKAAWTKKTRRKAPQRIAELRSQITQGGTIAIGYIGEGGAYAVAGLMIGWFGAVALAANQIVAAIGDVLYMVPLGIAIAVSIRIGQAIGADEKDRLIKIGLAALAVIISWMAFVMVGLFWSRDWLAQAFSDDPEVITLATSLFIVIAAMQIVDGVQGTMLGAARGMMDNLVPVGITMFSYWIIALPIAYYLGFVLNWGPEGVWIGYGIGLSLAAIAVTARFFIKARR